MVQNWATIIQEKLRNAELFCFNLGHLCRIDLLYIALLVTDQTRKGSVTSINIENHHQPAGMIAGGARPGSDI